MENNGGCSQICTNSPGSFECECHDGYHFFANSTSHCTGNVLNYKIKIYLIWLFQIPMNATITMVVAISFALIQLEASTAHVNQDTMAVFSVSVSQIFFGCIVIIINYSDINECDWGISGCSQKCFNTVGSYYCDCNNGYLLGSDNHTCIGNLKTKKLHGYYFIFIINNRQWWMCNWG